ncbi:hypothetical protein M0R45_035144 [Rubus argutus]|uniref:Uncharacterized protein n=1 Tax=Rubus argutus TaxID=59490 RepID=A0AAW1VV75_RUBAR
MLYKHMATWNLDQEVVPGVSRSSWILLFRMIVLVVLSLDLTKTIVGKCVREGGGSSNYGDVPLQASIAAQDWLVPSNRHTGSGREMFRMQFGRKMDTSDYRNQENESDGPKRNGNEEANEHSEGEHSINGEDLLDITDEYALDGEVGEN